MAENKFYGLYVAMFGSGLGQGEVATKIQNVQAVARSYSAEYSTDPLPITDPALESEIKDQFDYAISLNDTERQSLVNMLVTYHDLTNLKPWGDTQLAGEMRVMMW